jgi:hypothetical protein
LRRWASAAAPAGKWRGAYLRHRIGQPVDSRSYGKERPDAGGLHGFRKVVCTGDRGTDVLLGRACVMVWCVHGERAYWLDGHIGAGPRVSPLEHLFDCSYRPRVDGTYILRYHVADRAAVDKRLRAEIAWVSWPPSGDRQSELFYDIYSTHAHLMRRAYRATQLPLHGVERQAVVAVGRRAMGGGLS